MSWRNSGFLFLHLASFIYCNGHRAKTDIAPRKYTEMASRCVKMAIIAGHHSSANEACDKTALCACQNGHYQKEERGKPSCTAGGMFMRPGRWRGVWRFLKNSKLNDQERWPSPCWECVQGNGVSPLQGLLPSNMHCCSVLGSRSNLGGTNR